MKSLNDLKVKTKLIGGNVVLIAIMAVIGIMGIRAAKTMSEMFDKMYNEQLLSISYLSRSVEAVQHIRLLRV
ncbi:MAG: hypothetical protein GYA35_02075, partial [Thermoanaerobaculaceae bacterium]|nr:hypothetical protein [Thermoanaerobaculaceae bacterium]